MATASRGLLSKPDSFVLAFFTLAKAISPLLLLFVRSVQKLGRYVPKLLTSGPHINGLILQ